MKENKQRDRKIEELCAKFFIIFCFGYMLTNTFVIKFLLGFYFAGLFICPIFPSKPRSFWTVDGSWPGPLKFEITPPYELGSEIDEFRRVDQSQWPIFAIEIPIKDKSSEVMVRKIDRSSPWAIMWPRSCQGHNKWSPLKCPKWSHGNDM